MSAEVAIRRATLDDVPAIVALWHELASFHGELAPELTPSGDAREAMNERITRQLDSGSAVAFVALDRDAAVGFALLRVVAPSPVFSGPTVIQVTDLAVTRAHRRRGIGAALWSAARSWCEAEGHRRVELGVLVANEDAHRFWVAHGFEPQFHHLKLDL